MHKLNFPAICLSVVEGCWSIKLSAFLLISQKLFLQMIDVFPKTSCEWYHQSKSQLILDCSPEQI